MSDVKWTTAQQCAIDARGGPLLVSAAAGSGKTAVLVQRIIDIITDSENPTDIDRFLVVTFTNAAAAEMKQRIASRLEQLLSSDPFNDNLIRQQLLLPKAQISTIHSFCRTLAKEYFYALDIPADFRIADEDELAVMENAAMQAVFEQRYLDGDEDFLRLIDIFSGSHNDLELQKVVHNLHAFLQSQPFPHRWLRSMLSMFDSVGEPGQTIWGRQLCSYAALSLECLKQQNASALEIARSQPLLVTKYLPACENDEELIREFEVLLKKGVWDDICEFCANLKFSGLGQMRKASDEEKAAGERFKAVRKQYKDELTKLAKLFSHSSADFKDEIAGIRPMAESLFALVTEFENEFSRRKTEQSAADYNDLEHWALRLLVSDGDDGPEITDTAHEISSRFDFVMVDEYQDANIIQDTIFNAVSDNDRKLFVVGDVKQSIYRFRQAMPEIFIARRDRCEPYERDSDNYPAKINLDANFRSRTGVTDCVNDVFSCLMSVSAGEIDYTEEEALKPQAKYPEYSGISASFHLVGMGDRTSDERVAAEARYVGTLIHKIIKTEKVTENGELRTPTYSDFCILMRSANDMASVYVSELRKMGISAVCEKGDSFFSQPEIRLMMSLLRVIDNPARDIPVAAVMLSPLFSFTADELSQLRANNPGRGLYEVLLSIKDENEKAQSFCETIEQLRSVSDCVTSDELIGRIYSETLLPEIVLSSKEDGEYHCRNLRLLRQYARKYEATGFHGVSGFVTFLDKLAENGRDLSAAEQKSRDVSNAVRVMTIHKSKGLEFPICIVSALGKDFNNMDMKEKILFDSTLGIGVDVVGEEGLYTYKGLTRTAVENAKKTSMISEELRVLYVALTRAKERLVLVASTPSVDKKIQSAAKKLVAEGCRVSPFSVLSAKGFSDMILYCLLMSRCGEELRQRCGCTLPIRTDEKTNWSVTVIDDADEAMPHGDVTTNADHSLLTEGEVTYDEDNSEEFEAIERKLSQRYRYAKAASIPVKVSASALAERESGVIFGASSKPAFLQEGGMSAAEKGTALHAFAQHCDFRAAKESFASEKQRLVLSGFLTQRQADSVSEEKVMAFLDSPLMGELLSADRVYREKRFIVNIPAGMADPSLLPPYDEEPIVMQGAVDCLFEKDGELTVIDYKTDRVKEPQELAQRYRTQLLLYKYAAEQIFAKPVKRCVLYSFELRQEIEIS